MATIFTCAWTSRRGVVATQLGHSTPRLVEELYGHFKVGALEELDRAFGGTVVELRDTRGAHGASEGSL